ncbi:hypothetical protein HY488_01355, partial [Candidatus Woesearchaeota archaeon]|nr:hypothetical protein [Candidatus Woesearchaeota archaeon]
KQKKSINHILEQQWGFTKKLDYVYLLSRKNNLYFMNRDLEQLDMTNLRISSIGLYIGELLHEKELRLSIEGSQIIGSHATKNVIEVDKEQMRLWLKGHDLDVQQESNAFVIIKHDADFLGCGKLKDKKILNFVPKTRRILAKD